MAPLRMLYNSLFSTTSCSLNCRLLLSSSPGCCALPCVCVCIFTSHVLTVFFIIPFSSLNFYDGPRQSFNHRGDLTLMISYRDLIGRVRCFFIVQWIMGPGQTVLPIRFTCCSAISMIAPMQILGVVVATLSIKERDYYSANAHFNFKQRRHLFPYLSR